MLKIVQKCTKNTLVFFGFYNTNLIKIDTFYTIFFCHRILYGENPIIFKFVGMKLCW